MFNNNENSQKTEESKNIEINDQQETHEANDEINNLDYDQDIIYAQDIESGKDFTDITDVEKDDLDIKKEELVQRQSLNFKKKKFAGEQADEVLEDEQEKLKENNEKRKIIEKSPKERFVRFEDELGSGAIKRVYRGYDYDTGREIAWNTVNVGCMSEYAIVKIQEEIALIKKLKHKNIINFVSGFFNEEKKEIVIITEIFTSGSLKQHINKIKHPRLKVIKSWCKEILQGLKYLHELNNPIIHRDIKCDNIFINSSSSEIKIGDLGYSCILRNNDYAKSVSGTPEFMAPEVLTGRYGVKADIYSFGMCVLELVTREKPYKECDNLLEIFDNIKNNILPKSIEKIKNLRLLEFIKCCLQPQTERPSADDLLESQFLNDADHEENSYPALMYPNETDNYKIDLNISTFNKEFISNSTLNTFTEEVFQRQSSKNFPNPDTSGNMRGSNGSNLHKENSSRWSKSTKDVSPHFKTKLPCQVEVNKDEKLTSPFELCNQIINVENNNNNKNNSTFLKKASKGFGNKKAPDIVGLRTKKCCDASSISNTDMFYNQLYKRDTNNLNYDKYDQYNHTNSSSDDMDDVSNVKNFKEKFQYDPCIIKPSDIPIYSNTITKSNTISQLKKQTYINPFSNNIKCQSLNNKAHSKIEIKIEEEYKNENAIKISLVQKEKPKHKGQKISFKFDLNNDTCEKIVKELENENIGLNEEEKKIFTQKLTNLIRNYTNSIGMNNESYPSLNDEKDQKDQLMEAKILFDKFLKKFSKITEQAEEILQGSKKIKEELLKKEINNNTSNNTSEGQRKFDEVNSEFLDKIKILEEFLK